MIDRLEVRWRRLRRWLSRSEWALRLFGLSRSENTAHERGLVLIQIDGLGRKQFEKALARGKLPFIRELLRKQNYEAHAFYPGLPSSTPAVQGELHYGVHCAVPAFCYYDREAQSIFTMMQPTSAATVEKRLAAQGEPLLKGGSSYSNIYTGGAAEAHFCAASSGWGDMLRRPFSWRLPLVILANFFSVLRIIGLTVVEIVMALYDAVRGTLAGHRLASEVRFIFMRVAVCILLREIIVIGSSVDVARGLPIIHLNLLGYDEQAHRRGPDSLFAHWALKGIDGAVKRIWRAAHRSARRDYDVWIFSDHGQEASLQYVHETGRTLEEAVAEVFATTQVPKSRAHIATQARAPMLFNAGSRRGQRMAAQAAADRPLPGELIVCAMGPIAHVYAPTALSPAEIAELGVALSSRAHIPLVLAAAGPDEALAWIKGRALRLPGDALEIFGENHPHLHEVTRDMLRLVQHPGAGDFVLSGWRPKGKPLTFPHENGAHAGPGTWETDAFALLPIDAPLAPVPRSYIRPTDLREAALRALGRMPAITMNDVEQMQEQDAEIEERESFRIMSYNVHSCIGMDGKLSPQRIARAILQFDPDIVCLQELDVGRSRTGGVDQAQIIARALNMVHHFHPALRIEEEKYGDAILSRFPLEFVRADALPGIDLLPHLEPRGALWVRATIGGVTFQIITTHFGLVRQERHTQAEMLCSAQWLAHLECCDPVILCGDFNSLPRSRAYKLITQRLDDAQKKLERHRPRNTWFGRLPVGRIDHVFVSRELEVMGVTVPRNQLSRLASDHLPLIVDLRVPRRPEATTPAHSPAKLATI